MVFGGPVVKIIKLIVAAILITRTVILAVKAWKSGQHKESSKLWGEAVGHLLKSVFDFFGLFARMKQNSGEFKQLIQSRKIRKLKLK